MMPGFTCDYYFYKLLFEWCGRLLNKFKIYYTTTIFWLVLAVGSLISLWLTCRDLLQICCWRSQLPKMCRHPQSQLLEQTKNKATKIFPKFLAPTQFNSYIYYIPIFAEKWHIFHYLLVYKSFSHCFTLVYTIVIIL